MTPSQSALNELLDAIRAGGGLDLAREAYRHVAQELIELEASGVVGATRYERSEARTTHRNGSRPRLLSTKAGDVELHIPKLREGSFFPSLLQPRRRIDQALWAVIMEAYVHGVSTRKVDDLVVALGIEAGVSKSEVSRICGELDAVVSGFRERPLDHVGFPYLFLDATYVKAHDGPRVVSKAIVVATGVTATGEREVLGLDVGDSEDGAFWTAFLRSLRSRGLSGVRLVVSDAHEGLKGAIGSILLGSAWQRSSVHTRPRDHTVPTRPGGERLGSDDRSRSRGRPAPPSGGEAHTGPREMCLGAPNDERPGRAAPERGRSASGGRGTWRSSSASTGVSSTTRSMRWTRRVACGSSCESAMTEQASRCSARRSPSSVTRYRSGSPSSGGRDCSSSISSPGVIPSTR
jgi:hypothetical protein